MVVVVVVEARKEVSHMMMMMHHVLVVCWERMDVIQSKGIVSEGKGGMMGCVRLLPYSTIPYKVLQGQHDNMNGVTRVALYSTC